jgi:two-component system, OmpR family, response regulator
MEQTNSTILCIEDDKDTCELVTFVFKQEGYEINACSQTECLDLIDKEKFLAVILDNYFDGLRGTDICQKIRSFDQTTPIIFFSGEVRPAEIEKAIAVGANAYLIKPQDFERLVTTTIELIKQCHTIN